ncbi:MAG: hypothetical protein AABN34_15995 [Acidobacteriota bacterium]
MTTLGKFLASLISIMGIGMFALPTGFWGQTSLDKSRNRNPIREFALTAARELNSEVLELAPLGWRLLH